MNKTILAIDVGFGNTKAVWGPERNSSSEIIFKSVAPISMQLNDAFSGLSEGMDRIGIDIEGTQYLVGPEAFYAGGSPILDLNFVKHNEYLALIRGSIYYMHKRSGVIRTSIDCLVLGLPVSNFLEHRESLTKTALGVHNIPVPKSLQSIYGQSIDITVKQVLVLPQPMGALRVHIDTVDIDIKNSPINLIIDPGFNTFDWLTSHGMRPDMENSGSLGGGVSHILREVSAQAGNTLGVGALDLNACEIALASGKLTHKSRHYDFEKFRIVANAAADSIVNDFVNAYKSRNAFDRIVLTGGGAQYYIRALRKKFPDYEIKIESDSVLTNARGFYLFGVGLNS